MDEIITPTAIRSVGRPSEYKEEFLQTAWSYLSNYATLGDAVPTVEGLADELERAVKTLYNWGAEHEDFQHVLDVIQSRQGRLLQSKGLRKEIDSGITKLLLSANHGKAEKSETKLSGSISLSKLFEEAK